MKYVVTSPVFGEFRAYEPLAFELAKRTIEFSSTSKFKTEAYTEGKKAIVTGMGSKIKVEFENMEPFYFNVEAL